MSEVDLNDIHAGDYELVALRWDEITSKPGHPLDFVRHRFGDIVSLSVEEARRLVVAGAVVTPGTVPEVPGAGPSVAPGTDVPDVEEELVEQPAKSASKADWEAYARSQGATEADLEGQTKDELVTLYGG